MVQKLKGAGICLNGRLMPVKMLAVFEFVDRAAIGALGLAGAGHVQVHLGVAVPQFHVGQGAGAKHAALMVQIFGQQFNGCVCHGVFLIS